MLLLLPTLLPLLLSGCTTEMDCELSGDCVGGVCHCDVGWKGVTCSELDLVPLDNDDHYAYRPPVPPAGAADGRRLNTWGASQPIRDPETGQYHLFATTILSHCPLNDYTFNEELVHGVSDTLLGPYTYKNVALNTTIINPTVVQAPGNKEYVLFYSGEPLPPRYHKNCSIGGSTSTTTTVASNPRIKEPPGPPGYVNIGCVLSIATTSDLNSPFQPVVSNFTPIGAEKLYCRTNPTAYIYPNGTTLLYFRSTEGPPRNGANEQIWVARASQYSGPYTMLAPPATPNSNSGLIGGVQNEDPFIFKNGRGHFILMFHKSNWGPGWNGAKAYSRDGLTFNYTTDSMAHAWSSTVNYTDGSSVTFTRREEPKIYVEGGKMLAMFNAVQDPRCATTGNECTYVMSQAIKN